jgi:phosphate transporter
MLPHIVGGMASPIASPQNVIAMGILDKLGPVSWIQWFLIAIPIALTLDLLICILLLAIYQPAESAMPPEITASGSSGLSFNAKQWFVLGISLGTILLWCAASSLEGIVGDMGVIAILPIVVFYGTGILTKDDWNRYSFYSTHS